MTDEEIDALVKRLWVYGTDDSVDALAAIRWLRDQLDQARRERDEAREVIRDLSRASLERSKHPF